MLGVYILGYLPLVEGLSGLWIPASSLQGNAAGVHYPVTCDNPLAFSKLHLSSAQAQEQN